MRLSERQVELRDEHMIFLQNLCTVYKQIPTCASVQKQITDDVIRWKGQKDGTRDVAKCHSGSHHIFASSMTYSTTGQPQRHGCKY